MCWRKYIITGLQIAHYFRGAHNSWNTGPFRLHDSFHDSPSPCRHTPAVFWTARGVCGERAPVVYISACINHRWCVLRIRICGYTPPVYISQNILERPITLGILDRFGSTITSMTALAHADIFQLFSGPPEVCAANERRWCI